MTARSQWGNRRNAQPQLERRRRLRLLLAVAAASALVIVTVFSSPPTPGGPSEPSTERVGTGLPPWPAPIDPVAGERAAGLAVLPTEGTVQHFHVHLDLVVYRRTVTVPATIGIDTRQQLYAELHTHADSGVVHAEAAEASTTFTLGQFFTLWGVALDDQTMGGLRSGPDKRLWTYVNGVLVVGDPSLITLADHQEIVLAYGRNPPAAIPDSFDFAAHPI